MTLRFAATVERGQFRLGAVLEVAAGEVLAVLGPNGAGKSTVLRAVAGLLPVDEGTISLGDQVLDDPEQGVFVAPEQRGLGVVFQDHRLFPHLRVVDNVAFGLRSQGVSRAVARGRALDWLARLGVAELAGRHPRELSGGQAQRVALARALAPAPAALLLDEPLAALDAQTRAEVQAELRAHLGRYAGPTVLVTHDPVEALLLADPDRRAGERRRDPARQPRGDHRPAGHALRCPPRRHEPVPGTSHPRVGRARGRRPAGGLRRAGRAGARRGAPVRVHRAHPAPPQSSARIRWAGTVARLTPLADRIRLGVDAEQPVLVDVTASAVAELGLVPGGTVWLTAKATDVATYPDVAG